MISSAPSPAAAVTTPATTVRHGARPVTASCGGASVTVSRRSRKMRTTPYTSTTKKTALTVRSNVLRIKPPSAGVANTDGSKSLLFTWVDEMPTARSAKRSVTMKSTKMPAPAMRTKSRPRARREPPRGACRYAQGHEVVERLGHCVGIQNGISETAPDESASAESEVFVTGDITLGFDVAGKGTVGERGVFPGEHPGDGGVGPGGRHVWTRLRRRQCLRAALAFVRLFLAHVIESMRQIPDGGKIFECHPRRGDLGHVVGETRAFQEAVVDAVIHLERKIHEQCGNAV